LTIVVLDASVAAKFVFPVTGEALVEQSIELFDSYRLGKTNLLVPDLFWGEMGNVAWKGVRQLRWPRSVAEDAISRLQAENFPTASSRALITDAVSIALNYQQSVYDSLYVALAVATGSTMISADERLVSALAAHFPVKWLGALT
jgi:predicted nucleic acid-binding protein